MESLNENALESLFNETIYFIEEPDEVHVVFSQTLDFEGSNDYTFLSNVLNAVKQQIDKAQLHNLHKTNLSPKSEGVYLLFGVNSFEAGFKDLSINKYEVYEQDDLVILECDKLSDISADVNKKKALWAGLQRAFNL